MQHITATTVESSMPKVPCGDKALLNARARTSFTANAVLAYEAIKSLLELFQAPRRQLSRFCEFLLGAFSSPLK